MAGDHTARAHEREESAGPCKVTDRYRPLFALGRGGMGTVEVALERGDEGFERIVALKRLLPETARDPRNKEMFLREAKLAESLSHPNVVHAFAFGELDGEPYLAMEYVEGEPLSRVLEASREAGFALSPTLVAHVLAEACDGLHAAHELCDDAGTRLNVVHRDLSPHNVVIAYEGPVKLLDFGVAKFDASGGLTRTGEIKGKMAYMSPEQALGDPIDRRSDLYSVGAVLFECLTGQRMWGSGTDMDVMRKLALEEPPRLPETSPSALAALHARLVSRSPDGRPATAHAVAEELRAFCEKSGEAGENAHVAEVMKRLFTEDIEARRAALTGELEAAAPSRAEKLRQSLAPTSTRTSKPQSDAAEPVAIPWSKPKRSRAFVVAAAAMIAIAAGSMAIVATRSPDVPVTSSPREARAPLVEPSAKASEAPAPTTPPSVAAPSTKPSESVSSASTTRPPLAPRKQAPKPPKPPSKLPDVDPTPF